MLPDYEKIADKILDDTINKGPEEALDILLRAIQDEKLKEAITHNPKWLGWSDHFHYFIGTPEHLAIADRINANAVNNSLYKVFDRVRKITALDRKTLEQRALKTCEEAGETAGAVLGYVNAPGSEYKNKTVDDVIEEDADTFICVLSILAHAAPNMSLQQFMEVVHTKMDKWESKVKEQK